MISHFDIAHDVSTATASLLQVMGSTGLVQNYVWQWFVVIFYVRHVLILKIIITN